ncbi:MAG: SLC13 family permease [Acidimicrobiales bacterium]|jgi:arsenical pump membrane protein
MDTRIRPVPAPTRPLEWGLAALGTGALLAAVLAAPHDARAAAAQDWPPFVLVAGLLLVGLVADEDGLFAAGGSALARLSPNGLALYVGTVVLVVSVTTLLNLDTSVTFLTPVLVYAARSRGEGEAPLIYACLLLSNAGSLMLPGSNLTNLIVLGHLHLSGGAFFAHMAPAALAAAAVTALVVGAVHHRDLRTTITPAGGHERPVLGVGIVAVAAVTVLVVGLHSPAIPVAAVGIAAVVIRSWRHDSTTSPGAAVRILGLPVLVGLFGLAVALGTLGRTWSGPATLLSHLDAWGTAFTAALTSVLVNNLPAASLLAARQPPHPFELLVGLNIGPNMFVTGSLAWVLWLRSARAAGGRPDVRRASLLGLASAPLAIAAAVGVLTLGGAH